VGHEGGLANGILGIALGTAFTSPLTIEIGLHHTGHGLSIEASAEKRVDAIGCLSRIVDDIAMVEVERFHVRMVNKPVLDASQLGFKHGPQSLAGNIRAGPLTALEHFFLRRENLVQLSLHKDDLVFELRRQVDQQLGDHLDSYATRGSHPLLFGFQTFHDLQFVVATAEVRRRLGPDRVSERRMCRVLGQLSSVDTERLYL
jgi:hypothetical protein